MYRNSQCLSCSSELPTEVSSLLQVSYPSACELGSGAWLPCVGEVVLLFEFSWQHPEVGGVCPLLQAEPLIFPANKTHPIDLTKIMCIGLIRLIYWFGFFPSSFLTSIEFNLLMYLLGLDFVESCVPEHSLKSAVVLLLSLSHTLLRLAVPKPRQGLGTAQGLNLQGQEQIISSSTQRPVQIPLITLWLAQQRCRDVIYLC